MPTTINLFNILVPLFALVMIAKAYSHFRRTEKSLREFITWMLIWGAIGYIGFNPDIVMRLSGFLGIKSGLNVIIFFSIIILFYIVFKLIIAFEQTEMRITRLVRGMALKNPYKGKKK